MERNCVEQFVDCFGQLYMPERQRIILSFRILQVYFDRFLNKENF